MTLVDLLLIAAGVWIFIKIFGGAPSGPDRDRGMPPDDLDSDGSG